MDIIDFLSVSMKMQPLNYMANSKQPKEESSNSKKLGFVTKNYLQCKNSSLRKKYMEMCPF